MQSHLLVVDDDDRIRNLLAKYLGENNYLVSIAKDAISAKELIEYFEFDLAIIDLMIPGENGIELTQYITNHRNFPILMLTASEKLEDKIDGLQKGAEDYLTKPFDPRELLLRIGKILKRVRKSEYEILISNIIYNIKTKKITRNGQILELSEAEIKLFDLLSQNLNQVLTRSYLSNELKISERSVDVQIIRLRNKIENDPKRPYSLMTVRNLGYKLVG